jgi:hypothetical protein
MATPAPAKIVDPVTLVPVRFGLLSAVDLVSDDYRILNGVLAPDTPVGEAVAAPTACLDPDDVGFVDGIPWTEHPPIIARAGFQCRSVGLSERELNAEATQALTGVEGATVEAESWPHWMANLDFTLPDAADFPSAVGALEAWFWKNYGGTAILHCPRELYVEAVDARLFKDNGGYAQTPLGNRWVFGNYPHTGPADAAGTYLIGTGQIIVHRTELQVRPGQYAQALDKTTNEVFSVAERGYAVQVDAVRVAVKIGA